MVHFNWIDWVILAILVYYTVQGWVAGFADLGLSFITFLISLFLAVKFHAPIGDFLTQKFGIPTVWSAALGYVLVALVAQAILSEFIQIILNKLPKTVISSKLNKILGSVISFFNGIIIISFFLLVVLAFPLRGTIKTDVENSTIGSFFVAAAQKYGGPINSTISDASSQVMKFVTVEPDSNERISLPVYPLESELVIDAADEAKMVILVNQERANVGVGALAVDTTLTTVARAHSKDMFLRRYFSHVDPEGLSAGDRIEKAGVNFTVAGENIAYAPDLQTAHTGLMNSPGHRANILDPSFHHIGIGIISTNTWGMMFTQDFSN